jgi:hypothetical protein
MERSNMRNHKLINNRPKEITYIDLKGGGRNICPNEKDLIAFGCKELVRPEPPTYNYNEVYEETDTQIIVSYVEIPIIETPWHKDTNFQIKFRPIDLIELLEEHKGMIEYTSTLKRYTDLMDNVYFYVNYFTDMEKELIERFATVTPKSI